MSVPVETEGLAERIAEFGARAFLVTVGADGRPHVTSVAVRLDGRAVVAGAGRTTRANVAGGSPVTLLWPPSGAGAYCLLVDGRGAVDGDEVAVSPTRAVLHRVVGAAGEGPSCVEVATGP